MIYQSDATGPIEVKIDADSNKESNPFTPKDLSGDPVYDYLKGFVLKDFDLVGGIIKESKPPLAFNQPRVLISIYLKHKKSGKQITRDYNYKKLQRGLK